MASPLYRLAAGMGCGPAPAHLCALGTLLTRVTQQRGASMLGDLSQHVGAASVIAESVTASQSTRTYGSRPTRHPERFEDADEHDEPAATPWVRSVIGGVELLRNPKYNKGLNFSNHERDRLYLRGLLPPAVLSQEVQVQRSMLNVRTQTSDLAKYSYLINLLERNERLFFRVVSENLEELLPILGEPTVEYACDKYSLMFRSLPKGMFVTLADKGRVYPLLKNWPERRIKLICITDGERVGRMGDLGVQAINVCTSNMAVYTACGGINPSTQLPVLFDVGTNNEDLLHNPFYVGMKHRRIGGETYHELLDEFMASLVRRYGHNIYVHLEDMKYKNSVSLLQKYRGEFPIVSDSQGIAAAVLAGVLSSIQTTGIPLNKQRIMVVGEGGVASIIAELMATAVADLTGELLADARKHVWMVDSKGLVTGQRGDSDTIHEYKLPYIHDTPMCDTLLDAVKEVKPTVMVGYCLARATAFPFDEDVVRTMARHCERPVIIPLHLPGSHPDPNDIMRWTKGQALFAGPTGHPDTVTNVNGKTIAKPGQCTSKYIFPGLALGTMIARSTRIKEEQLLAAAETVAGLMTEADREQGSLYPSISNAREISMHVARAVANKAYEGGYATDLPKPHDLVQRAREYMYDPDYRTYR